MASCAYCNTSIFFGGVKADGLRFCNAKCQTQGALLSFANQLPQADVANFVNSVHRGACPECQGAGPVDVHRSYRVWSAVLLTSWNSRLVVSCQPCGTKKRIGDTLFSAVLGWWGFPWGLLVTPMQIGRNVVGFFRKPNPDQPSPELERILRLHLASHLSSQQAGG